jgi:hypothetical protein
MPLNTENIKKTTALLYKNDMFIGSGVIYFWEKKAYVITAGHVLYGNQYDISPVLTEWTIKDPAGIKYTIAEIQGDAAFARANDIVQLRLAETDDLEHLICPIFLDVPENSGQEFIFRGKYRPRATVSIPGVTLGAAGNNDPVNKGPVRFDERVAGHPYKFFSNIPKEQLQNSDLSFGSEWLEGCSGSGLFLTNRQDCLCAGILLEIPDRGDNGKLLFSGIKVLKEIGFGPKILEASIFEFNPDYLTADWFGSKLSNAIAALGKRYSPTVNFHLPIAKVFNGISRNSQFRGDLNAVFNEIFKERRSVYNADDVPEISMLFSSADTLLEAFKAEYLLTHLTGEEEIPFNSWTDQISAIAAICEQCRSTLYEMKRAREKSGPPPAYGQRPYETEIRELRDYLFALSEFTSYISGIQCIIANDPYIILKGDAGFGKSHLLGDIAREREAKGCRTVLLLGHQFQTQQNPWQQIISRLSRNGSEHQFLGELNARGAIDGRRVLLIIDAINEGEGKRLWHDYMVEFLLEARRYPWVGLALSIRSSYERLLIPEQVHREGLAQFVTHHGFTESEEDAADYFFDNYGIARPGVPLLHPEFGSPLFLKLFCEGLQRKHLTSVPPGFEGITMILGLFLDGINEKLAAKFRYNPQQKHAQSFIEALAEEITDSAKNYVTYNEAVNFIVRTDKLLDLTQRSSFWDDLIEEGVLSKELYWTNNSTSEEGYIIAYERFHEHLLVSNLLKKVRNPFRSGKNGNVLHPYIGSESAIRSNPGIVEALSIQMPEKFGLDLFDVCGGARASQTVAIGFVKSLVWRTNGSYSASMKHLPSENFLCWIRRRWLHWRKGNQRHRIDDYLTQVVTADPQLEGLLLRQLLLISGNKGHPYNAEYLHRQFLTMSLPERDTTLLPWLAKDFKRGETVKRLIRWAWKELPMGHLDTESIFLSCIMLSWLLISSNRKLRDEATKSLICLLFEREDLIQPLLEKFDGVNDPYVYERLLAVAYGCTLRAGSHGFLKTLCDYLLTGLFSKDTVYPHILVRDYARGICEFALYSNVITEVDYSKAQPPYRSQMPSDIASAEYISDLFAYDEDDRNTFYLNKIADSMNVTAYGDFGNYLFEEKLDFWEVDPEEMKRFALSLILQYGYNVDQYGPAERKIADLQEDSERIGKKYQYLAMFETLAIVADNCAVNRDDDDSMGTETYEGAWQKRLRDIDVSTVIRKTLETSDDPRLTNPWWVQCTHPDWTINNTAWMLSEIDLPDPYTVLEVKDSKEVSWITLQTIFSWGEDAKPGDDKYNSPHKRMYMHYRPYLIHKDDVLKFQKYCESIQPRNNHLPEARHYTTILSREFYWSEAYTAQQQEYFGGNGDYEIFDRKSGRFIINAHIPVEELMWEESLDHSKEGTLGYLRLSNRVWHGLDLTFNVKEGVYVDQYDRIMCLDPSVYEAGPGALLIDKTMLTNYLLKNDLVLTWYIQGAKQILSARHSGATHDPRVEHYITGFACFDGHTILAYQKSHIHKF